MEVEGSTEAAAFTEVAVTGNPVQVTPTRTNDMENVLMRTKPMKLETPKVRLAWMVVSTALLLLAVGYAGASFAQDQQPKTFSSPGGASKALFQAVQNEDEQSLEAILGAGKEVTSSSDEVDDKLERERFSQKYQEMHRLVREPDGSAVLYIGAENWPFPVPLVSKNGAWYFDSKTGMQEIRFRRIGENEATAIQVCNAFALAKKQGGTKATSNDDSISQYAQGLFTAGTTSTDTHESALYHGYYFRIVSGNSPAGRSSYVSSGKKRIGLALVAYPAEYRSSGVMTFVVSQGRDVVYEKDLGPNTATLAKKLGAGDSAANWQTAE